MATSRWNIVTGAIGGIAVWLAYGTVEFGLFSVVPVMRQPDAVLNAPVWHATAMLFAVYALIGAALGAISGGLAAAPKSLLIATLPLPIAFTANLLNHWPLTGAGAVALLLGILLIAAMAGSLRSLAWGKRFAFVTGPFAVSLLLLLPLWIGNDLLAGRSGVLRLGAIAGAIAATVLVFQLLGRLRSWTGEPRTHRYALGVAGLLALACAVGAGFSARPPVLPSRGGARPERRPNVVLIVMDTVRADHTSLYGYERDTTPYLHELAKEATLYTRALAVSDFTSPTHASMFTGLYPRTHGVYYAPPNYPNGRPLSQRFTTLAEILQTNGYRTAGIVANFGYLSRKLGFDQGFELYDSRAPVQMAPVGQIPYLRRTARELLDRFVSTVDFEVRTRRAGEINQEAYKFLDGVDSPFFLFVNYMDAHSPFTPPSPFDLRYPCSDTTLAQSDRAGTIRRLVLSGKRDLKPEERSCLISGYDGGIAYLDSQIHELIVELRARGLFDNTLLMITSDHGEAFGRRNQLGHGGISVYQDEVGVPLLVKYPGVNSETRVDAGVSQVDLLPTVLDVTSISAPTGLQGISLRRIEDGPSRFIVSVSYPNPWMITLNRQYDRVEEALLFGNKKLIESTSGKHELFDLSIDVNEEHNSYRDGDPAAQALSDMLQKWLRSVPPAVSEDRGTIDTTTVERLKSLGYAQ